MRKFVFSIVVVLYLLLSSGVVVHLHYCMDRLAEIGLFAADHEDVCNDCGMQMNEDNDCCHDRTDVIKLKQDQTHSYAGPLSVKKLPADLVPFQPVVFVESLREQSSNRLRCPDDPLSDRYRYRLIEVFRI